MTQKETTNFYCLMLGLSEEMTAPDHYQILGLPQFASDPGAIREAAAIQNGKLLKWQNSQHFKASLELVREIIEAKRVLESPDLKQAYDESLRQDSYEERGSASVLLFAGWCLVGVIGVSLIWYVGFHRENDLDGADKNGQAGQAPAKESRQPGEEPIPSRNASYSTKTEPANGGGQRGFAPVIKPAVAEKPETGPAKPNAIAKTEKESTPEQSEVLQQVATFAAERRKEAEQLVEEGDVRRALQLYEQIAELPGQSLDLKAVRHLYARAMQWDKACEAWLKSAGPHDYLSLLVLYEAGRLKEFHAGRTVRFKEYTEIRNGYSDFGLARCAAVLPVQPEYFPQLRLLVQANADPKVQKAAWRRYLVGRMMYRLGEFSEWDADLPEDSPLKMGNNQLLIPLAEFQKHPTPESRRLLEQQTKKRESEVRRRIRDGVLGPYWHDYVIEMSLVREAKRILEKTQRVQAPGE